MPCPCLQCQQDLYKAPNVTAFLSWSSSKLLNLYLCEKISSLTTPDLVSNCVPISINWSSSTGMVAVGVATSEAIGDGMVSDTMGDELSEGTTKGARETGSKPDDHSSDGGVSAGGAGDG
ncbi:hypothetical protein Tco_0821880 [Tanacetum coccineum]|uniref:Uncharacterized protein n=1 Tax=Tanacetum coccineum TaxID=301880 RepID=A0ABQ5ADG2_9ASTR